MIVQDYLRSNDLDSLQSEFAIKVNQNDDGRIILNYNQIESPKENIIVGECRGLVLDADFNLVARAFPRFFNLGEVKTDFNWSHFYSTEKVDGSLILIYYWNNKWRINTRNSFGNGLCGESGKTWAELVDMALPHNWRNKFDPRYTYVGELCSPWNHVVRYYDKPTFYLLTLYEQETEINIKETLKVAQSTPLLFPCLYSLTCETEVVQFINDVIDTTYEGLVLRDDQNRRTKIKTKSYLRLHRLFANGNIMSVKNLLPIVLNGEVDEVLTYWPELRASIGAISCKLNDWLRDLDNYWFTYGDEPSQKKFALAVKEHPLCGILFMKRKMGGNLWDLMRQSESRLLKLLEE